MSVFVMSFWSGLCWGWREAAAILARVLIVRSLDSSWQALSLQEYIPDVAVLYSVDWLLGMFRTATNIWGDACACVVVDTWARRHAKKHGLLPIKNPESPTEMEMGMESSKKDDGAHLSQL